MPRAGMFSTTESSQPKASSKATADADRFDDPVAAAAREGDLTEVQRLLHRRADPNLQDALGETPLFEAAARNDVAMAEALLAAGADPDIQSHAGNKAIDLASSEACRALLASASKGRARGPANEAEPEEAGEDEVVESPEVNPLPFAARQGDLSEVRRLLAAKADPNSQDIVGETPLFEAAASGSVSVAATLLLAGADPDHQSLMNSVPADLASSGPVRALLRLCSGEGIANNEKRSILDSLVPELRIPVKRFIQSLCMETDGGGGFDEEEQDDDLDLLAKPKGGKKGNDDDDEDVDFDVRRDFGVPRAKAEPPKPVVDIELVVSHAIQEGKITLSLRSNNTFGDVKKILTDRLRKCGQQVQNIYLVRKERDAYQAYKDRDIIGDVRHVRMVGATLPSADE